MFFALSVLASVLCYWYFFRFAKKRISIKFARGNDYHQHIKITFWKKSEQRQGKQNIRRDIKQVLTPSEWIYKFHCTDCDRGQNFTLIWRLYLQMS